MSATEDDPIDVAAKNGLRTLNRALKASGLDAEDMRSAALCMGADCIMSAAESSVSPRDVMLGTIQAMLEAAMRKGWLPPKPANATMVLVLSDEGVSMGVVASKAVH